VKRLTTKWIWPLAAVLAAGACSGTTADDEPPPPGPPPVIIDLLVDTNRDGLVDEADNTGEDIWSIQYGASFLPNLDDDDFNGVPDAEDNFANILPDNNADQADYAPIVIRAWPDVPKDSVGWLSVDAMSLPHVRVFRFAADGTWQLAIGADKCAPEDTTCPPHAVQLSYDDIVSGVLFGIEGRTLVGLHTATSTNPANGQVEPWSGVVTLDWQIFEPGAAEPIKTDELPDGIDRVQTRVAPWILFGNLTKTYDTIYSNVVSNVFVQGIETATTAAEIFYNKITNWNDRWTEDWMQTGFASIPAPDGKVHGMRLAMPRPWGRTGNDAGLPVNWLKLPAPAGHLGWDTGYFVVYKKPHTGNSYDSHGNHDLVPAYTNPDNGQHYPYGRIAYGSGVLAETKAFYEAQLVQAPAISVKTSWLAVGHIDEVFSYVPANTERGWKLLVGSPSLAVKMLKDWQTAGHGAVELFVGKMWHGNKSAAISIDDTLADQDLMTWSDQSQAEIDGMLATMKTEVGLKDDEIIEIPYLFEVDYGSMVAWNPGTVNSLVFHDYIVIADPFGPNIDGADALKKDLQDRLGTSAEQLGFDGQGLKVYFTDDWTGYHIKMGEVHCGTNQEGPPQADIKWWEAMQ